MSEMTVDKFEKAVGRALIDSSAAGLPEPVTRRGITESGWRALFNLFPGAKPDSVLLVWDYCKTRQLDAFKKPCHIVPMRVKVGNEWAWRDVVMPGIYEYRITAQRTGLYLGHTDPDYGPEVEVLGVTAPAWCTMTIYRWNEIAGQKVSFPVKVWFREVVATTVKNNVESVNDRWTRAPVQMLTKCTEAAGLREAFPEELGGQATAEEMDGQRLEPIIEEARDHGPQPARRKSADVIAEMMAKAPISEREKREATKAARAILGDTLEKAGEAEGIIPPIVEGAPTPAEIARASVAVPGSVEPIRMFDRRGLPDSIGRVASVKELLAGALVTFDTGFQFATGDAGMIASLKSARDAGTVVEAVTREPKRAGYALQLVEIRPYSPEAEQ